MFNLTAIHGRIVRDFELREINGKSFIEFDVACNRDRDEVDYIPCKAWGKTAEFIAQYFHKGKGGIFSGRMRQERWEKDGNKRQKLVLIVSQVQFDGSPKEESYSSGPVKPTTNPSAGADTDDLPF